MGQGNEEKAERKPPYSPEMVPGTGGIAYNLDEGKPPGGLKVRKKTRKARGKDAERVAARQAEAIRELQRWAAQRQQQEEQRARPRRSSRSRQRSPAAPPPPTCRTRSPRCAGRSAN